MLIRSCLLFNSFFMSVMRYHGLHEHMMQPRFHLFTYILELAGIFLTILMLNKLFSQYPSEMLHRLTKYLI